MNQMNLFDAAGPINEPRFKQGDYIYKVTLDVLETYVIDDTFSLGVDITGERTKAGNTLWRYHLSNIRDGSHNVFGEYECGDTYFSAKDDAKAHADKNRRVIEGAGLVLRPSMLALTEAQGFVHYREEGCLHADIGRLGARAVYARQFCCYPFLYVFQSESEAIRFYRKTLADFKKQPKTAPANLAPQSMYKVSDGVWSSYEYAARHGNWTALGKPASKHFPSKMPGKLSADDIRQVLSERASKTARVDTPNKRSERSER
jgi:hypothetical protein